MKIKIPKDISCKLDKKLNNLMYLTSKAGGINSTRADGGRK